MKNSGYYPLFHCYFINLTFLFVKPIMTFRTSVHHFKSQGNAIQRLIIKLNFYVRAFFGNHMNVIYFFNT
jgi:hypothetical protein